MRRAVIDRRTSETSISLSISLDGKGTYRVGTGIRFLDHMLELFARHGAFDLKVKAKGDLDVDQHHTVEDLGIALGEAVAEAIGNRRGINRAGYFVMPMDETLAVAARANVHVKVLYGRSSHHKIEAVFKAFARALRVACAKDKRLAKMLPSTKGLL